MTDSTITVADVLFCLPAIEAKADQKAMRGAVRHPDDRWSCPACALAHSVGFEEVSNLNEYAAAKALGVPLHVIAAIAQAADLPTHPLRAELEAYLSW